MQYPVASISAISSITINSILSRSCSVFSSISETADSLLGPVSPHCANSSLATKRLHGALPMALIRSEYLKCKCVNVEPIQIFDSYWQSLNLFMSINYHGVRSGKTYLSVHRAARDASNHCGAVNSWSSGWRRASGIISRRRYAILEQWRCAHGIFGGVQSSFKKI